MCSHCYSGFVIYAVIDLRPSTLVDNYTTTPNDVLMMRTGATSSCRSSFEWIVLPDIVPNFIPHEKNNFHLLQKASKGMGHVFCKIGQTDFSVMNGAHTDINHH